MSQFNAGRVLRQPLLGFITLCGLIAVFCLARSAELIDAADWQRSQGLIVSVMLLVMGNYVPKLRPFQGSRIDRIESAAAERFAGRALMLAGLVSFLLFIGLPLSEARPAAAWLGVGTCTMITSHWGWLAYTAPHCAQRLARSPAELRSARIGVSLLIGYTYICASVWLLNLLGDGPLRAGAQVWLLSGFSLLVTVILPSIEGLPRARCRARLPAE